MSGGKVQRPCRVCEKLYTPCIDCDNDKTAFHWRSIVCSTKCAKVYFAEIEESRTNKVSTIDIIPKTKQDKRKTPIKKEKNNLTE